MRLSTAMVQLVHLHILKYLVVLVLCSMPALSWAQQEATDNSSPAIHVGLNTHYGFIIPHSNTVRHIASSNPRGVEADISLHFTDGRAWQYVQGYPRLGASLAYYNFDNPDVLGNAYALLLYAEPFLSAHKKFSLSFRLGGGIAYLDNVYDEETNPENLFYSTTFSFPLVANLMANWRIGDFYMLRLGGTYQHISNGGRRQPNKGINFPMATVGLHYSLKPGVFPDRQLQKAPEAGKQRHVLFALITAYRDRNDKPDKQAALLGFTAYLSQRIGRMSALTAGGEWIADWAIKKELESRQEVKSFQRAALLAGHELQIGRFRFNQQLGIYVYAPVKGKDPVYQRWGLEYHTPKRLFFGINLKAHRHVAEFLDMRVGMRIN